MGRPVEEARRADETPDVLSRHRHSHVTWKRTKIRKKGPHWLRMVSWPFQHNISQGEVNFRWFLSGLVLIFAIWFPSAPPKTRYHGHYDPVLYRFRGYMKKTRNKKEGQPKSDEGKGDAEDEDDNPETNSRCLWPPLCCYTRGPRTLPGYGKTKPCRSPVKPESFVRSSKRNGRTPKADDAPSADSAHSSHRTIQSTSSSPLLTNSFTQIMTTET